VRSGLASIAASVALFAVIADTRGIDPPSHSTASKLAFVSDHHGQSGIYAISLWGDRARFVVAGSAPSWSADGESLAYITLDNVIAIWSEGGTILDTGVAAWGSEIYSAARVAWSPDGTKITYGYNNEVWVMNATMPYDPHSLTDYGYGPSWSPDSQRIAYTGAYEDIFIMDADGSNKLNLTDTIDFQEDRPDWSPDGLQLLFLGSGEGGTGVWVMDVDGTDRQFLAETVQFCCGSPEWSPDGQKVAFVGGSGISMMRADGSGLRHLEKPPSYEYEPSWGVVSP
jgi:Tol biopolymer transport system component